MWWKRKKLIENQDLRIGALERIILSISEKEFSGKIVKSGEGKFKVEHVSIVGPDIFLHGGLEKQMLSFANIGVVVVPRPYKEWSIVVNAKDVEVCE